jgi:hypothetical protein
MNPAFKKMFVEALRSGRYKQCRGHMHVRMYGEIHLFCALGVVADLIREELKEEWHVVLGPAGDQAVEIYGLSALPDKDAWTALLAPHHLALTGLTNNNTDELLGMNDNQISFNKIADYVEQTM